MGGRHRSKPLSGSESSHEATGLHAAQDSDAFTAAADPSRLTSRLASELFARLLLELPVHHRELQSADRDGNPERLARAAHKLLGAVVYCELPELSEALRELKQMTESGDAAQTRAALDKVFRLIYELLASSGYRET